MAVVEMLATTRDDAEALAPMMRAADQAEVYASSGRTPLEALLDSIERSAEAWTVTINGELACIWGVGPHTAAKSYLGPRIGVAWLLTTHVVERYAKEFWRECKRLLPLVLEQWDVLVNAIDARHTQALRWAKRLGLQLQPPAPLGAQGRPFVVFTITKGDVACVS